MPENPNESKTSSTERPSLDERADQVQRKMMEAMARYGGNPELLYKEHPEYDFVSRAKERQQNQAK